MTNNVTSGNNALDCVQPATAHRLQIVDTKTVARQGFYTSADIARILDVSMSRVRQLRDEANVAGQLAGNSRIHTHDELLQIIEYVRSYRSNWSVEFVDSDNESID